MELHRSWSHKPLPLGFQVSREISQTQAASTLAGLIWTKVRFWDGQFVEDQLNTLFGLNKGILVCFRAKRNAGRSLVSLNIRSFSATRRLGLSQCIKATMWINFFHHCLSSSCNSASSTATLLFFEICCYDIHSWGRRKPSILVVKFLFGVHVSESCSRIVYRQVVAAETAGHILSMLFRKGCLA